MPTIKVGRSTANYFIGRDIIKPGSRIELTNYQQRDVHTCGFVAALTVVHYFNQDIPAKDVLTAVRPSLNHGLNRYKLIGGLDSLGITPYYCNDLTIDKLREYVKRGVPVIVSVWPDEWMNDHWTVVWGFGEDSIYLTNYGRLPLTEFYEQWSDFDMRGRGASSEGIVCSPRT